MTTLCLHVPCLSHNAAPDWVQQNYSRFSLPSVKLITSFPCVNLHFFVLIETQTLLQITDNSALLIILHCPATDSQPYALLFVLAGTQRKSCYCDKVKDTLLLTKAARCRAPCLLLGEEVKYSFSKLSAAVEETNGHFRLETDAEQLSPPASARARRFDHWLFGKSSGFTKKNGYKINPYTGNSKKILRCISSSLVM